MPLHKTKTGASIYVPVKTAWSLGVAVLRIGHFRIGGTAHSRVPLCHPLSKKKEGKPHKPGHEHNWQMEVENPPVAKGHCKRDLGGCPMGDGVQSQGIGAPVIAPSSNK